MKRCLLTIGGLDVLGGGGIGTDMKTMEHYGFFSLSVISLVAGIEQGEFVFHEMDIATFEMQLATIAQNFQNRLAGIKIGLLANPEQIKAVYQFCQPFIGKIPIVIDPVLAFKETLQQANQDYLAALQPLLAIATILTPNLPEACLLLDEKIPDDLDSVQNLVQSLQARFQCAVYLKVGARLSGNQAVDFLALDDVFHVLQAPKIKQATINGAGCCLSSALCGALAQNHSLLGASQEAKKYVYQAIQAGLFVTEESGNVWPQIKGN